ncbi:MAG TPA: GNAT family N-acetyltransferase [Gaiellaceae bacterium]|nr:GNAT family N-acetyltransferase [Gaiellaceae bacterium]
MRIRRATEADETILRELWEEFETEVPEPPGFAANTWEETWADVRRLAAQGLALVAEDDEGPVGHAWTAPPERGRAHVHDVYVRPRARRRGVARALLRETVAALRALGAEWVSLHVLTTNRPAVATWERLGFAEVQKTMVAEAAALEEHLAAGRAEGPTFGSVHAQTDDLAGVERAVRMFVPRLGRSAGSVVVPPRNGWIAVYDELCSREPELLRRLARELSDRVGVAIAIGVEAGQVVRYVLFDRGRMVDEYLSVPDYRGPLPPGDVIALGANPTLLQRLTGAEPARVRAVARTASSPADLPPATELVAQIGELLGLAGVDLGYPEAAELPGALRIER